MPFSIPFFVRNRSRRANYPGIFSNIMNFPDDPWLLLELDRQVAGEREVKRAYARLLKQHRPESDPEGFRRVNEAYQAALADLARGSFPDPSEAGLRQEPESSGSAGASVESQIPALMEALQVFEDTRAETGAVPVPQREVDAVVLTSFGETRENLFKRLAMVEASAELPEFTRLRNLVRHHPELADRWVPVLQRLVEGPAWHMVVSGLHAEDVWLLMREGEGQFAAQVMLQWRENPAWLGRFGTMGNLLLQQQEGLDHPDRLQAMHFTARAAAFYLPEVSARLADELFRQTSPGVRERIASDIEVRSAAGKTFSHFGLPLKRFWEERIFESDPEEVVDWSDPWKQTVLREVVSSCASDWEGWGVVTQVVPEAVLRPILSRRREPKRVYQTEVQPDRPWFAGGGGRWTWIAAFVILKGIFLSFSSHKDPPLSSYPGNLPEYRENRDPGPSAVGDAQRRLDELRGKATKPKGTPEQSTSSPQLSPGGNGNLREFYPSYGPGESSDAKKLRLEY